MWEKIWSQVENLQKTFESIMQQITLLGGTMR
jgi:hypothetical protein